MIVNVDGVNANVDTAGPVLTEKQRADCSLIHQIQEAQSLAFHGSTVNEMPSVSVFSGSS